MSSYQPYVQTPAFTNEKHVNINVANNDKVVKKQQPLFGCQILQAIRFLPNCNHKMEMN